MKILTLKLPPDLDAKLREVALRRRVPVSVIARESLAEYVTKAEVPTPGSFLERAGDLIGRVEAPPDRSSDRGAMAGYGESRAMVHRRKRR